MKIIAFKVCKMLLYLVFHLILIIATQTKYSHSQFKMRKSSVEKLNNLLWVVKTQVITFGIIQNLDLFAPLIFCVALVSQKPVCLAFASGCARIHLNVELQVLNGQFVLSPF